MATEENPLLSLSPDKQRQLANLVENGDIEQISEQTGLSRRQVLGIGGALLASAGVGGLTAKEIIQEVQADASTTDSDGNVGLPGDRVDVFADGVDSNSVNTGALSGNYPGQVYGIAGGSVVASIDPANTSTPIQDAIDAIKASNPYGTVLLPQSVDSPGNLTGLKNISLLPFGGSGGTLASAVTDTDPATPTFNIDTTSDGIGAYIDGIQFNGGGSRNAPLFRFNAQVNDFNVGRIKVNNYSGDDVIHCESGGPYQSTWEHVQTNGGYNRFLAHNGEAAGWRFGTVALNSDTNTVPDIEVLKNSGKHIRFDVINKGGTESVLFESPGSTSTDMWSFGMVNFEPSTTNTSTPHVFYKRGSDLLHIEALRVQEGIGDGFVTLDDSERNFIGLMQNTYSANVKIETDIREPSVYAGSSSEVTNGPGSGNLTGQLSCLGDLTAVN